jgi:hypothetical protein
MREEDLKVLRKKERGREENLKVLKKREGKRRISEGFEKERGVEKKTWRF